MFFTLWSKSIKLEHSFEYRLTSLIIKTLLAQDVEMLPFRFGIFTIVKLKLFLLSNSFVSKILQETFTEKPAGHLSLPSMYIMWSAVGLSLAAGLFA